jgi:hypothetical protein
MDRLMRVFLGGGDMEGGNEKKVVTRRDDVIDDLFDIMGFESIDTCYNKMFDKYTLHKSDALQRYKDENMHERLSNVFKMKQVQRLRKEINTEKDLIILFRCIVKLLGYTIMSAGSKDPAKNEYVRKYWITDYSGLN